MKARAEAGIVGVVPYAKMGIEGELKPNETVPNQLVEIRMKLQPLGRFDINSYEAFMKLIVKRLEFEGCKITRTLLGLTARCDNRYIQLEATLLTDELMLYSDETIDDEEAVFEVADVTPDEASRLISFIYCRIEGHPTTLPKMAEIADHILSTANKTMLSVQPAIKLVTQADDEAYRILRKLEEEGKLLLSKYGGKLVVDVLSASFFGDRELLKQLARALRNSKGLRKRLAKIGERFTFLKHA